MASVLSIFPFKFSWKFLSNTDTKILSDHNEMDIDVTFPENSDMRLQAGSGQIAPVTNPNDISGVNSSSPT